MGHARIGIRHFGQGMLATPRDNDFVAKRVEGFSKAAANAGTAARDKNGVVEESHSVCLVLEFCLVEIGNQPRPGRIPAQFLPRLFA